MPSPIPSLAERLKAVLHAPYRLGSHPATMPELRGAPLQLIAYIQSISERHQISEDEAAERLAQRGEDFGAKDGELGNVLLLDVNGDIQARWLVMNPRAYKPSLLDLLRWAETGSHDVPDWLLKKTAIVKWEKQS